MKTTQKRYTPIDKEKIIVEIEKEEEPEDKINDIQRKVSELHKAKIGN